MSTPAGRAGAPLPADIRQATPDDADAVFAVHQRSVHALCAADYPAEHIAAWFTGRSPAMYARPIAAGQMWVAEGGGRLLGFVGAEPGEVTLLFVAPEAAGQGVGRQLFEFALAVASQGFDGALTVVATKNSAAFYARFGFLAAEEQAFIRGEPPLHYPVVKMLRYTDPPRARP